MKKLLNVDQELEKMNQYVKQVEDCTAKMARLGLEADAQAKRESLTTLLGIAAVYAAIMFILRAIFQLVLPFYVYAALAIAVPALVQKLAEGLPEGNMRTMGNAGLVLIALATIIPVIPDFLPVFFSDSTWLSLLPWRILPTVVSAALGAWYVYKARQMDEAVRSVTGE